MVQHLTVARIAEGLAVSWNTANDAVLAEGQQVLINDEHRFDGVHAIGVDEHVWRHTRPGTSNGPTDATNGRLHSRHHNRALDRRRGTRSTAARRSSRARAAPEPPATGRA